MWGRMMKTSPACNALKRDEISDFFASVFRICDAESHNVTLKVTITKATKGN
jgi:hypothetical protein